MTDVEKLLGFLEDPSSYDPADTNIVADDTLYAGGYAFDVAAITVIAAIVVAGLCFGIYYWMRRRYRRVVVCSTKNQVTSLPFVIAPVFRPYLPSKCIRPSRQ